MLPLKRGLSALVLVLALCVPSFARNFTGPEPYVSTAESMRSRIARFWTGKELPNWYRPCPITVVYNHGQEISGATSFRFEKGHVGDWAMRLTGPTQASLLSIVGHEVDHAVRHSLARRMYARWVDEGCSNLFETEKAHERYRRAAWKYKDSSGSAWNQFDNLHYAVNDRNGGHIYPTGFSIVEWMLAFGDGRKKMIDFLKDERLPSDKLFAHYGLTKSQAKVHWEEWYQKRHANSRRCGPSGCPIHNPQGFDPIIGIRSPIVIGQPRPRQPVITPPTVEPKDLLPDDAIDPKPPKPPEVEDPPPVPKEEEAPTVAPENNEKLISTIVQELSILLDAKTKPSQPNPVLSKIGEWAPTILTGLGVSIPGGAAGWFGIRMLTRLLRRRRERKAKEERERPIVKETVEPEPKAPFPRELDETRQLLQLGEAEGRVPAVDSLRGMLLDDLLDEDINGENEERAQWATKLKQTLTNRVERIAPVSTGKEKRKD